MLPGNAASWSCPSSGFICHLRLGNKVPMAWLGGISPRITPSAHIAAGSGDLRPLPPAVGANIILVIPINPAACGQIDQVGFIVTGITAIDRETTLPNKAHPFAERTGHRLKKHRIIVGHTNSFPENPGVVGSRRRASPSARKKNAPATCRSVRRPVLRGLRIDQNFEVARPSPPISRALRPEQQHVLHQVFEHASRMSDQHRPHEWRTFFIRCEP